MHIPLLPSPFVHSAAVPPAPFLPPSLPVHTFSPLFSPSPLLSFSSRVYHRLMTSTGGGKGRTLMAKMAIFYDVICERALTVH